MSRASEHDFDDLLDQIASELAMQPTDTPVVETASGAAGVPVVTVPVPVPAPEAFEPARPSAHGPSGVAVMATAIAAAVLVVIAVGGLVTFQDELRARAGHGVRVSIVTIEYAEPEAVPLLNEPAPVLAEHAKSRPADAGVSAPMPGTDSEPARASATELPPPPVAAEKSVRRKRVRRGNDNSPAKAKDSFEDM